MNGIESLEKGEQYTLSKIIEMEPQGNFNKINFTVYYQDVLTNWYKQEVEVNYLASSITSGTTHLGNIDFAVKDEERIKQEEVPTLEEIKAQNHKGEINNE